MGGQPSASDHDGGKPYKRNRVSQACEPCRTKKGKCDGRQPTCCVCQSLGIDCSYDPNPKKRGLRPGQVSSLERRAVLMELVAAFLMARDPESEESVRSFFCVEDSDLPFLTPGQQRDELEEKLGSWRQGPISRWLFQTAARVDPAVDQLSKFRSHGQGDNRTSHSGSQEPSNAQEQPGE